MEDTLLASLRQHAQARPDEPAYYVKNDGAWCPTSWREYREQVHRAGRALMALGLEPGDTVGIMGANRPEWTIGALGAITARGVPFGIYTTSPPDDIAYNLNHAEPRILLLEEVDMWEKLAQVRDQARSLEHVVFMQGADLPDDPLTMSWEAFLSRADDTLDEMLNERLRAVAPKDTAVLVYTAGTTGQPKGVMLSHTNLLRTIQMLNEIVRAGPDDRFLSYLPLAHTAEQLFTIHGALYTGHAVYYVPSLFKLPRNLREVQPTLFFGVPRVWETFRQRVEREFRKQTGWRRWLIDWATGVGRQVTARRNRGEAVAGWLAVQHWLADRLFYSRVKPSLGLKDAHFCGSGAAPIAPETLEFFAGLDVTIYEGYSQSEASGATTADRPGQTRFGTVGVPLSDVDVRLADDGEVLVRGPNVFKGYHKDPAKTADVLVDGWLHTGDLGRFDQDGFLVLTGRKKEIIVTSTGENLAPQKVETRLKALDLVSEAVVFGDGRSYLTALLTLDDEAAARFAEEHGINQEDVHQHSQLVDRLQSGVDAINRQLAPAEEVRDFRILPRDFSIEAGELTPTLKIKRHVIAERYADLIEDMYT